MKIQIILASTRPARIGERVAKWVTAVAKDQPDFEVELVDLAEFNLPHFDEPISPRYNPKRQPNPGAARWIAKAGEADGYVIVTPEYNHSFPGILKDALDYLDWQINRKPVAIVGYGSVGGARSAEQLKLVVSFLGAAIVPGTVAVTGPQQAIDEAGQLTNDAPGPYSLNSQLVTLLGDLAWWTQTLKAGRETLAKV